MQAGVDEAPDILGDMTKELVKKVEDAVDVEAERMRTEVTSRGGE